jgi:hypothetical protein
VSCQQLAGAVWLWGLLLELLAVHGVEARELLSRVELLVEV